MKRLATLVMLIVIVLSSVLAAATPSVAASATQAVTAAETYTIKDLGTLGGTTSIAYAINASGQVAGVAKTVNGIDHAFLYDGAITDLGTLGGAKSTAHGINDAGQIVGTSDPTTGYPRAFLWQNGTMTDLGTLGGSHSYGYGINDAGQIVGDSLTANSRMRAFLWQNGTMTDLGTLGGGNSWSVEINNAGQVAGTSVTFDSGYPHPFVWQNGTMTDLVSPRDYSHITESRSINASGHVVGESTNVASQVMHAFLYRDGSMINLNTLLPAGSGWELKAANDINDAGQIVGRGLFNGQERAFLMMPAPTPTPTPTPSPTPSPSDTEIDYFALGDSVASGHGLQDDKQACRRSIDAYPHKVADAIRKRGVTVNFPNEHFLACSGATVSQPASSVLALNSNKWFHNQVENALKQIDGFPLDRPVLVSITVGANDFGWADQKKLIEHLYDENSNVYDKWVAQSAAKLRKLIKPELKRLLAKPNVAVILTEYYNPFNASSILFRLGPGDRCGFFDCYDRTERGIDGLNTALSGAWADLGYSKRIQISYLRGTFRGHESPRESDATVRSCGQSSPEIADTWIQYIDDPTSNSNPTLHPAVRYLTGGNDWRGDCFHPNNAGAEQFAKAVNDDAIRLGR